MSLSNALMFITYLPKESFRSPQQQGLSIKSILAYLTLCCEYAILKNRNKQRNLILLFLKALIF